jgi:lipoprotein NlpD
MSNSHIATRAASVFLIAVVLTLTACATKTPAPVSDRRAPPVQQAATPASAANPAAAAQPQSDSKPTDLGKTHTVQKGDTLIGLALQYGLDYRELAAWNNIENPNVIKLDSVLRLTPPGTVANGTSTAAKEPKPGVPVATPLVPSPLPSASSERPAGNTANSKTEPRGGKVPYTDAAYQRLSSQAAAAPPPAPAAGTTTAPVVAAPVPAVSPTGAAATPPVAAPAGTPATDDVDWAWPVKGKIMTTFTDANKGIDIAGAKGTAVNAAGSGKVIYSGSGLRGYGRLVIIKHNATWFSAYAHNDKIVVAEGQEVKRGQKIAEMGNSDADQVKLHFEIRKNGRPLDPTKFLPPQ